MRSRRLLVLLLIASSALGAFCAVRWQTAERRERATKAWTQTVMDSLIRTLPIPTPTDALETRDSLYWVWVATLGQLQSRRWQQEVRRAWTTRRTLLEPFDVDELRRRGLADPARQLRDSLVAHPELIPVEGVLGGTMAFVPGEEILLFSPHYAFAAFEDGHIGGHMLLRFGVEAEGRVFWERLWVSQD
ncbi:MAG TPA: hypothetical protein VEY91_05725 [Candidatus Limnocylindria bacterium]|nr:hypothetical protein [Candidatus Limnocylindria bacterium]